MGKVKIVRPREFDPWLCPIDIPMKCEDCSLRDKCGVGVLRIPEK